MAGGQAEFEGQAALLKRHPGVGFAVLHLNDVGAVAFHQPGVGLQDGLQDRGGVVTRTDPVEFGAEIFPRTVDLVAGGALQALFAEKDLPTPASVRLAKCCKDGLLCHRFRLGIDQYLTENGDVIRLAAVGSVCGIAAEDDGVAGFETAMEQIQNCIAGFDLQPGGGELFQPIGLGRGGDPAVVRDVNIQQALGDQRDEVVSA